MVSPRRLIPVLVAAAAVAAVAVVLAQPGGSGEGGSATVPVPGELPGGYRLVEVSAGEEARRMVASIHWSPERIPVVDAAVAVYSDGTRLWVTRVEGNACSVAAAMASKMAAYEAALPYTAPVPHEIGGRTVYLAMDKRTMGLHAFWCSGDLVVWVELGGAGVDALAFLVSYYG